MRVLFAVIYLALPVGVQASAHNLITNPDFEQGLNGWQGSCPAQALVCAVVPGEGLEESQALQVDFNGTMGDTNFFQIYQDIAVQPGTTYLLSYLIKTNTRTDLTTVAYALFNAAKEPIACTGNWCNQFRGPEQPPGTTAWTTYGRPIRTTADTAFMRIMPRQYGSASSGIAWWDNFSLVEVSSATEGITIATAELSVSIDSTRGGITHIFHRASDTEFLATTELLASLYTIRIKDTYRSPVRTLDSVLADCFNAETVETDEEIRVEMNTCHSVAGLYVSAKVRLLKAQAQVIFEISVENRGNQIIQSIDYPIIDAKPVLGADSTDDFIVAPFHTGNLYRNPGSLPASGSYYLNRHPGAASVQMLAYYDSIQSTPGLYLQSTDVDGYSKELGFERRIETGRDSIRFLYRHYQAEVPGADFDLAYDVRLQPFFGDWVEAATLYKLWALQQWWAQKPLSVRTDIPNLLYEANVAHMNFRLGFENYAEVNGELRDAYLSAPNAVDNFVAALYIPGGGWGRPGTIWSGVDYFYPYNGEVPLDPLRDDPLMASALELADIDTYLYAWMSGNKWDIWERDPQDQLLFDDTTHFEAVGRAHVIVREDGTNYFVDDRFSGNNTRYSAYIDIGSARNSVMSEVLVDNVVRALRRKIPLISLDQIVGGYTFADWSLDGDHGIGRGRWLHDRYVELLLDIQQAIDSEGMRGIAGISMEETNEYYLPFLQMHLVRPTRATSFSTRGLEGAQSTNIPLFHHIYSGYFLSIEQWGDIHKERMDDPFYYWRMAGTVMQGNIPAVLIWGESTWNGGAERINVPVMNFFKKLLGNVDQTYRGARLLRPPDVQGLPPTILRPMVGRRPYSIDFFYDPIRVAKLHKPDATLSVILVSTVEEPTTVQIPIDSGDSTCPLFDVYENLNGDRQVLKMGITLDGPMTLTRELNYKDLLIVDAVPTCPKGFENTTNKMSRSVPQGCACNAMGNPAWFMGLAGLFYARKRRVVAG